MMNPVGTLMVEAAAKARKKKSGEHTSEADCGCRVLVAWFSEHSTRTNIQRCAKHPVRTVTA